MYAWSNDNDTETDSTHSEPELYEFSSSPKANTTETKIKNLSQNTDLRDYPLKVANVYQSSDDFDYFESSSEESQTNLGQSENEANMESSVPASDTLLLPVGPEESPGASEYQIQDTLGTSDMVTAVIPLIDALALSNPAPDTAITTLPAASTSVFSNSSLAKEMAAALAAPNPNGPQGLRAQSDSFNQVLRAHDVS
jgi:hypothetical protein